MKNNYEKKKKKKKKTHMYKNDFQVVVGNCLLYVFIHTGEAFKQETLS